MVQVHPTVPKKINQPKQTDLRGVHMRRIFLSAFAGVFLPSTVFALDPARTAVVAEKEMIAAADPRAVKVGLSILEKGGSAIDAVIATQLVLNLVEPQSSGIGGGSLLLFYDKASQKITALDGREKAPAAAKLIVL